MWWTRQPTISWECPTDFCDAGLHTLWENINILASKLNTCRTFGPACSKKYFKACWYHADYDMEERNKELGRLTCTYKVLRVKISTCINFLSENILNVSIVIFFGIIFKNKLASHCRKYKHRNSWHRSRNTSFRITKIATGQIHLQATNTLPKRHECRNPSLCERDVLETNAMILDINPEVNIMPRLTSLLSLHCLLYSPVQMLRPCHVIYLFLKTISILYAFLSMDDDNPRRVN